MNEKVAKALCDAEVLKLGLFDLASGRKSPVYVDLRILPSFPESFEIIADELTRLVKELKVDVIAGAETAGIPYAAAIAIKAKLPMVYVRKRPKGYGTNSMIEGILNKDDSCVLIDDMVTNAGSKLIFIDGIRETGASVEHVVVTLDREQGAMAALKKEGVKLHSLITLRQLLDYMIDRNMITREDYEKVVEYLDQEE